jgi:hypothetical protein
MAIILVSMIFAQPLRPQDRHGSLCNRGRIETHGGQVKRYRSKPPASPLPGNRRQGSSIRSAAPRREIALIGSRWRGKQPPGNVCEPDRDTPGAALDCAIEVMRVNRRDD